MSKNTELATHPFTLVLEGTNPLVPEHLDALFNAGCDDAAFGQRGSVYYADFVREAPSFAEAVESAIAAVEGAVPGLRVVRVEPEELVSASDVAQRTGRSRESVRLLIEGKRGPGHFPQPALWLGGKRPLWRWADVADWYATRLGQKLPDADHSAFLAALNGAFDVRRHAALLVHGREREVVARIVREDQCLLRT